MIYYCQDGAFKNDIIYHHTNELLLQTGTSGYVCVTIQLPFYLLVPITFHITIANIYSKNSETTSTWCPHHNYPRYIYVTIYYLFSCSNYVPHYICPNLLKKIWNNFNLDVHIKTQSDHYKKFSFPESNTLHILFPVSFHLLQHQDFHL